MKRKFFTFIVSFGLLLSLIGPARADNVGAVQYYQQARTYAASKHWPEAAKLLENALKLDPGYADALYMAAICYLSMEETDKAIPLLKRLTNLRPEFTNGWGMLANAYVQKKDYAEARKAIGELSKAPGGGPESRYMSGVLCWIEGKIPEAEKEWREAIRLRPEMAKAHYNLGVLCRLKGERVRAMSFFHDALRHNGDNFQYRYSLATLQLEMGNKIDGRANLDKVKGQTERPDLSSLALAYQLLGDEKWQGAEKAAQRAIDENEELTEAYVLKGKALVKLEKDAEAKEMFKKALELDINIAEAKAALKEIEDKEARLAEEARLKAEQERLEREKAEAEAAGTSADSEGGSEGAEAGKAVGSEKAEASGAEENKAHPEAEGGEKSEP